MAFNKLLEVKKVRKNETGTQSDQNLAGMSMYMEYFELSTDDSFKFRMRRHYLLKGKPMSTIEQLEKWQKELELLQQSFPEITFPLMLVDHDGVTYEVLDSPYLDKMYYFYE